MKDVTEKYIIRRLLEAATTEKHLQDKERRFFATKSTWPDYVQEWFKGLHRGDGLVDADKTTRVVLRPTASQISNMDEVLDWLAWLSQSRHKDAITLMRIVWAVSCGYSYMKVSMITGVPLTTCKRWYRIGIYSLRQHVDRERAKKRKTFI
jgi:hypothetical protein